VVVVVVVVAAVVEILVRNSFRYCIGRVNKKFGELKAWDDGIDLAAVDAEFSWEVEGRKAFDDSGIKLGGEEQEAAALGPRARDNPGSVPGFEHSVNAEQGSMGAGAGAAATIDHDTPPRGTAIEKAQAELRFPNPYLI
jgi:hypothetical protein